MMSVKREKKYFIIGVIVFVLAVVTAAVIYCYVNRFDPQEYVQAFLDVSYKQETEQYRELTGISEKEAKKVFEDNLDYTMEKFPASVMSDKLEGEYRELFGTLAKQTNYTVGEGTREKDGTYQVEVSVKPITLLSDTYAILQEKAQAYAVQVTNDVMNGQAMPTDDEMQSAVYQIYYDVLKDGMNQGLIYGNPCTVLLHLDQDQEGYYEIRKSDLKELDHLLIENVTENDPENEIEDEQDGILQEEIKK